METIKGDSYTVHYDPETLTATFSGFAYPYLLSIAASLLTYVIVSVMERVAERMRDA